MNLLTTYRRLSRWPLGNWLFSRAVCLRAPYFATIAPRFVALEPGRCEVRIRDRRRVHNHIGTVHAIALCNLAELSAGVMTEASLPASMRWIPKGMTVEYLKKARGTMHAVATPDRPVVEAAAGYDLPVTVSVRDPQGTEVFRARILMWLSPKSRDQQGVDRQQRRRRLHQEDPPVQHRDQQDQHAGQDRHRMLPRNGGVSLPTA